ncbi:hypothetical protein [Peredibacter starrii]|uniref:Uncharacterized protein n=1 Tax=Peredibacter starrii TaxID=28202 RepID=A0AAX4HRU9_9BACT|nr:hypothetical protein [Peredibacter starrii]WPU65634.1 hypothetical protein SOO65_02620 [Peredibacter starrii]
MHLRLILFFIVMGGLFWFFRPKPQAQSKEQPKPYVIPKNTNPQPEVVKPVEPTAPIAVTETTPGTPAEVPAEPVVRPSTEQTTQATPSVAPPTPEWAKIPEQSPRPVILEDKLDDLHDYAPLLKNRLLAKYSQDQFDHLVQQSDQYLRNEAEYEKGSPAKAKEVRKFIDDLYEAKKAAEMERKL